METLVADVDPAMTRSRLLSPSSIGHSSDASDRSGHRFVTPFRSAVWRRSRVSMTMVSAPVMVRVRTSS
jgi:hypothetical protein